MGFLFEAPRRLSLLRPAASSALSRCGCGAAKPPSATTSSFAASFSATNGGGAPPSRPLRPFSASFSSSSSSSRSAPPGAPVELRGYQRAAIDALRAKCTARRSSATKPNALRGALAVLPPGTGKSLLCAELIRSTLAADPTSRIIVLTHSKELVEQNERELRRLWASSSFSRAEADDEEEGDEEEGEEEEGDEEEGESERKKQGGRGVSDPGPVPHHHHEQQQQQQADPPSSSLVCSDLCYADVVGVFSAGLGERDGRKPVVFATIQSLYNKLDELVPPPPPDLIIIDEAHLVNRDEESRYGRFLAEACALNGEVQLVGLTATPYRLDSGALTKPFTNDKGVTVQPIFDEVVYEYKFRDAVREGYLSPVTSRRPEEAALLSDPSAELPVDPKANNNAKGRSRVDAPSRDLMNADFTRADLEAFERDFNVKNEAIVDEIIRHSVGRGSWLIFCVSVRHARDVAALLRARGVGCEAVTGDMPREARRDAIHRFRSGHLQALTNVQVLQTGFNASSIDLVALLRPTQSAGLYYQMVGRGARTSAGKVNCLLLDFAGNIERHGLVDELDRGGDAQAMRPEAAKRSGDGEDPLSRRASSYAGHLCRLCRTYNPAFSRTCESCGEPLTPLLEESPSTLPASAADHDGWWADAPAGSSSPPRPRFTRYRVVGIEYRENRRPGRPPTMRVEYLVAPLPNAAAAPAKPAKPAKEPGSQTQEAAGVHVEREWICFEHPKKSYPRTLATKWWQKRVPASSSSSSASSSSSRRGKGKGVPRTVDEALERSGAELPVPAYVDVKSGQFAEIIPVFV